MKRIAAIGGLLLVLILPLVSGQEIVTYTIPSDLSVNGSFLWIVSLPPGLENARASWVIIGLVESGALGSFEKLSGNKWFCEFDRTCGPNPFPMAGGPYDANIYVTSDSGVLLKLHSIMVSDLVIDPHLYITDNNVLVQLNVPEYGGSAVVKYSLYDADTLDTVQLGGEAVYNKNLEYCNCPAGFYNTSLSLENGNYYMSFDVSTTDGRSGGSLKYFTIGEELKPLTVSLDKGKYWSGEKIPISGTTTFSKAGGVIRRSGVEVKNISLSLYSRGEYSEFSYDYLPSQTGNYVLEVTAGYGNDTISKTVSFTVSNLLDIIIPDIYINESETLWRNFTVTNIVNQTINITVSPDDELESYVTASLEKDWLGVGESTTLTLSIRNLLSSVQGNIVLHTNLVDIEKEVRIIVKKPLEEKSQINIYPLSWSPEEGYLLGMQGKTFTITNQGTGTLEGFDHSLDGIDSDIVTVTLPSSVSMVPDSGDLEVSIDPLYSGRYRGTLTITSNGGSQDILIDLEFFDDISSEIETLELEIQSVFTELSGRGIELPSTISELVSDLTEIQTSLDNGDYASAGRDFGKAKEKWSGVQSMVALIPAGGMDLSLVLIIAVVLVVAVAGFFLFRKLRGRGAGKKEEEEETEEDLEEEELF